MLEVPIDLIAVKNFSGFSDTLIHPTLGISKILSIGIRA
jgi:hypothetical protein